MANFVVKDCIFSAKATFHSKHATTIVVDCSDGRFTRSDDEFMEAVFQTDTADEIEFPGGIASLHPLSSSSWGDVEVMRAKLAMLVNGHKTERIVLMSHHGCLHYQRKYPSLDSKALMQRQLEDMVEVLEDLRRRFPGVEICAYYKTISDKQHVLFYEVQVG